MREKTKILKYEIGRVPTEVDIVDAVMMCSSMDQKIYGADRAAECTPSEGFPIPMAQITGHVFKYYVSPHRDTEIAIAYYDMFDEQEIQ